MGTLVTLDLPNDSPVANLPWVITIGALGTEEDWEPVVCGPYERAHALALAQAVVADEDLMAVVEPLLPLLDAEAIRDEVDLARRPVHDPEADGDLDPDADLDADADPDADDDPGWETRHVHPGRPPTEAEVRESFLRIAKRLTTLP